MPIVPMADAVPGQVAQAAEYNKIIDNVEDLDSRLQSAEGVIGDASVGNAALDSRVDTLEARTTHVDYGNTALDARMDVVEARTTDVNTGNTVLGTRVTSLESVTSDGTTGNSALGTRVTALETRTLDASIGNQALRDDLDALTGEVDTSRGRHIFTGSRSYGPGVNDQNVDNWVADGANASYCTTNGTQLALHAAGRWAIRLRASSDGGPNGISEIRISWPSGGMPDNGVYECGWRGGGFGGAGKLIQNLDWTGYVTSTHITGTQFVINSAWTPQSGTGTITYNFILEAYFLGA